MSSVLIVINSTLQEIPLEKPVPVVRFLPAQTGNLKSVTLVGGLNIERIDLRKLFPSGENMPLIQPGMALLVGEVSDAARITVDAWISGNGAGQIQRAKGQPVSTAQPGWSAGTSAGWLSAGVLLVAVLLVLASRRFLK